MASTNPVPSRAALNALRGVLFTTSCSVLLLAEERRRRLKIAHAAIDNARKLHTIRSSRGPIALSEGVGSWEGRLSDLGDEVLSLPTVPKPRTSYRRRRRDNSSNPLVHDGEFEIHNHSSGPPEPSSRSDHAGGIPPKAPQETHALGINLGSIRLIPPAHRSRCHGLAFKPLAISTASTLSSHPTSTPRDDNVEPQAVSLNHGITTQPPYHDVLTTLERLLEDLAPDHVSRSPASETLDLAIAALQKLGCVQPTTPELGELLKLNGIKLLGSTVELDPAKTPAVLEILLPKCKDALQVLSPLTSGLQEKRDGKGLEQLLEFLSDRKQSRFWIRGMAIYRLLSHQNKVRESFEETKHLYQMFQEAGLFGKIIVPRNTEYKIRRHMAMMGLEAGDDVFAHKEMQSLYKLEPEAAKSDIKLQGKLIVREAALGQWDSVRAGVEMLTGVADTKCSDFKCMMGKITETFAQTCSPEELEALLRRFVCDYSISLKYRWVNLILDRHASRHQLDSMFSWLQFCSDSGLQMDDAFIQSFYSRCRKYWSFSEKSIAKLHRTLQTSIPSMSKAFIDESSDKGGCSKSPAQLELGNWASESDAFQYMELLATQSEWERVCGAYIRVLSSDLGFSTRCLRLAVLGQIKGQDGCIEGAASLLNEARAKGHDVSEALTPLLLARLEKGDDANDLIKEALRRGTRIHDSVYNKAAQALSEKGDLRGAAALCEVAARQNGNGELLYSEYNFSNLVFAYTGSARYKALQSILSKFTAEVQWWRGSRTCKESIKLAMKTAAMRAVVNPKDKVKHQEALYKLDEALTHVKKCRSTREDRRAVTEAFIRVVRPLGNVDVREKPCPEEMRGTDKTVTEGQPSEQVEPATVFHKPIRMVPRHGLAAAEEA